MSENDDSTTTPVEALNYRLNEASLRMTYAKCLVSVISNHIGDMCGRRIEINEEETLHAICHSIGLILDEAASLVDSTELRGEDRP